MLHKLIFAAALAATVPSVAQPASIDAARSTVTVHVYKTGLFSALAHNHVITAPIASGSIDKEHRSVSLSFGANALKVADPEGSESDHQEIEATMKGPAVLNAAQFPVISFQSKRINVATLDSYQVIGDLSLHGQTREISLPVVFSGGVYKGSVHLKQTDFGIMPVKVVGGAVRVKDEIEIDFEIVVQ
jgi:polyisoprenoid-binding protein YceI